MLANKVPSEAAPTKVGPAQTIVWMGPGHQGAWGTPLLPSYIETVSQREGYVAMTSATYISDGLRSEVKGWQNAGADALRLLDALMEQLDGDTEK